MILPAVDGRIVLCLAWILVSSGFAFAASEFNYLSSGGKITISGYNGTAAGILVIPATIDGLPVTNIDDGAFDNSFGQYDLLTGVSFPQTVTRIGSAAFFQCHAITSITLPRDLTQIDSSAFAFTGLNSIIIPQKVSQIQPSAFSECRNLGAIAVPLSNLSYSSVDGVLFDKSKSTLIRYPQAKAGQFVIPQSVSTIAAGAFSASTALTAVTIPSGVASIGAGAFSSCSRLAAVDIPASVTNIGSGAFSGCLGLAAINVHPSNPSYTSLDGVLFNKSQTSLIQCPAGRIGGFAIPPGCTSISDSAFAECIALSSVTIPPGLSAIGKRAFENCVTLSSVGLPSSVTALGERAFSGCAGLAEAVLSPGIPIIEPYTFSKCASLMDFVLPATVTAIRNGAFENCSGLTEIAVPPGVTTLGSYAFAGCASLASVTLPSGLLTLDVGAFSNCGNLQAISLPASLNTIGPYAFSGCRSLTGISIPSGVASIGSGAFGYCSQLMGILVDASNAHYSSYGGVLFNKTQSKLIQFPPGRAGEYEIPSSVAIIGNGSFGSCRLLSLVTMAGNVTSIESSAFSECTGLSGITVGAGVTSIGSFAFNRCENLGAIEVAPGNPSFSSFDGVLYNQPRTSLIVCPGGRTGSISIPATVTTIPWNAFPISASLTAFQVDAANSAFSSVNGILLNKSQTSLIRCPNAKSGVVQIQASVTTISSGAFSGCGLLTAIHVDPSNPVFASLDGLLYTKSLETIIKCPLGKSGVVTLSAIVTGIRDGALSGVKNLTDIDVNAGNPVFASVDGVLFNKSLTKLIQYPGGKSGYVFIPATVFNMGSGAFDDRNDFSGLVFLGNSPSSIWFSLATSVPIQHFQGAIGFSSTWNSWPLVNMGASTPVKLWLMENSYPYDTSMRSDLNGDGVSLLMAYALNLDPGKNLASSLPIAELAAEQLSITFYAESEGISYQVETAGDLSTWTTEGVTVSQPDSFGFRTASVPATDTARFIRLAVSE